MGLPREFPCTFVPSPRLYFSPKQLLEAPRWLPKARGGLCHLAFASFLQGSPSGPLPPDPCSRALVVHLEAQGLLWEVSDPSVRIPCFLRAPWHPRPPGEPHGSSFCGPTGQGPAHLFHSEMVWCRSRCRCSGRSGFRTARPAALSSVALAQSCCLSELLVSHL